MVNRRYVLSCLLALCLPSSVTAQGMNTAPPSLGDGWAVTELAEARLDPAVFSILVERIDSGWIPNVHALLIEHKGRLAFERYWPGEDVTLTGPVTLEYQPSLMLNQ